VRIVAFDVLSVKADFSESWIYGSQAVRYFMANHRVSEDGQSVGHVRSG
jgi:hypothetical protein